MGHWAKHWALQVMRQHNHTGPKCLFNWIAHLAGPDKLSVNVKFSSVVLKTPANHFKWPAYAEN